MYEDLRELEFRKHNRELGRSPNAMASTDDFIQITNVEVACSPCDNRSVGGELSSNSAVDTQNLTQVRKKEEFWKRRLMAYEPTTFCRYRVNVASDIDESTGINVHSATVPLPVLDINGYTFHGNTAERLMSAFVAFIGHITCNRDISLGILSDILSINQPLYSEVCPGVFTVDLHQKTHTVIHDIYEAASKYSEDQSFLLDMLNRYPELRGQKLSPHHNIVIGKTPPNTTRNDLSKHILHDSNILLLFNEDGREMHHMYMGKPGQDFRHIDDVLNHFPTFLKSVTAAAASQPLYEIQSVTEEELEYLYPPPGVFQRSAETAYDVFEHQCMATPRNIALKSSNTTCTYAECKGLVESVRSLLQTTSKDERIIGLYLPNSMSYVVAVLGVLKAGRAFLPLPVDYPVARIAFTTNDAQVRSLLTTVALYEKSTPMIFSLTAATADTVQIDKDKIILVKLTTEENSAMVHNSKIQTSGLHKELVGNADIGTTSSTPIDEAICYVMYTSGSTGRPKGVQVTHSGVINIARAQIELWSLGPDDTIAQFASIGFDATISEIFTALYCGATLAILDEKERLGQEFIQAMNRLDVNTITLAPSALNIYSPSDFPKLTKVISAGEACSLGTALKWNVDRQKVSFFNAYGPTETTVCATCHKFIPPSVYGDNSLDRIPIGRAISGMHVYLFNDFMKPVPPNVTGEIYVGGIGISNGCIGHAAHLNHERFVQNPVTFEPSILYRTGDEAFQSADGTMTYIGRLDNMAKIRGQRVELDEIEQVLIQHTQIDMAVVVVHRCSQSTETSIAAYVSPSVVCLTKLRECLRTTLPKYMIPTFIKKIELKDFPMTFNGKIDKKRLENDESVHDQRKHHDRNQLTETQLSIAKLWCMVLKLNEANVFNFHRQTSFGELGGNSLQLVLLQRTLEDRLHVKLSFMDLVTVDTIEEFTDVITRKKDMVCVTVQLTSHDPNGLRQKIIQDSLLDPAILSLKTRRGSVKFSAFVQNCSFKYPRNALISGVTGFLGAHLLAEVMEQSNAHVYCMVRASTEVRGLGRIIKNLRKYNLWKTEYEDRISVIISDITQENLGINPDIYTALCNIIDVIFMNAAKLNFNTDYDNHKVSNVDGTKGFIKFAFAGSRKYIFTTSSLSVFLFPEKPLSTEPPHRMCYESEFFSDPCLLEGGYGKTKWASERLVVQALDYLPGGAIFRPARISGSSQDGIGPRNDLFASTLIGMTRLGSFPDMNFPYDLTPVDYVAKAMVEISLKICNERVQHKQVYHLFNPQTIPFRDIFKGMDLKCLPLAQWRQELRNATEDNTELIPFTPVFLSEFWDKAPYWPIFDTTNTDLLTSDRTKALLLHSGTLLRLYKSYFRVNDMLL